MEYCITSRRQAAGADDPHWDSGFLSPNRPGPGPEALVARAGAYAQRGCPMFGGAAAPSGGGATASAGGAGPPASPGHEVILDTVRSAVDARLDVRVFPRLARIEQRLEERTVVSARQESSLSELRGLLVARTLERLEELERQSAHSAASSAVVGRDREAKHQQVDGRVSALEAQLAEATAALADIRVAASDLEERVKAMGTRSVRLPTSSGDWDGTSEVSPKEAFPVPPAPRLPPRPADEQPEGESRNHSKDTNGSRRTRPEVPSQEATSSLVSPTPARDRVMTAEGVIAAKVSFEGLTTDFSENTFGVSLGDAKPSPVGGARAGPGSSNVNISPSVVSMMREIDAAVKKANRYKMRQSVWDASIFLGYRALSRPTNVLLGFAVLVNLVMQLSLCVVVAFWFSADSANTQLVSDLGDWRQSVNSTVVQRVCQEDPTLETDYSQLQLYSNAKEFTTTSSILQLEIGPMLATIVIFMWTLNVTDNLRDTIDCIKAVRCLRNKSAAIDFLDIGHRGDVFTIRAISRGRACWVVVSLASQVVVAVVLLVSGSLWLVYTDSITDLMLNAVALSYIMQVDELVYNVMVPRKVKALLERSTTLEMQGIGMCGCVPRSLPRRASTTLLFAASFLFMMVVAFIYPHAREVHRLRQTMCGEWDQD